MKSRLAIRYYRTNAPVGWVTVAYAGERDYAMRLACFLHARLGVRTEVRISHDDDLALQALASWT